MSAFPVTSVTLIAKIKNLAPGEDSAAWVRFWDTYQGAIRAFAALKGGEQNADDIVMQVLGKLVDVLRSGQYTPEKGKLFAATELLVEEFDSLVDAWRVQSDGKEKSRRSTRHPQLRRRREEADPSADLQGQDPSLLGRYGLDSRCHG